MSDDAFTRDVFEQLSVPPESSRFYIELEQRLRARDRAALRRWRRTAIVAVAVAVAATAATGVMASTLATPTKTVDQTVVCTNIVKAGIPVFNAGAKPTGAPVLDSNGKVKAPPPGFYPPTSMWVQTGDVMMLLRFSSQASGYQLDRSRCSKWKTKLALSHRGLQPALMLGADSQEPFGKRCTGVAKMAMRVQLTSDSLGVPLGAKLVIARAKTGKPLIYVEWTRDSVKSWAASGCETYIPPLP